MNSVFDLLIIKTIIQATALRLENDMKKLSLLIATTALIVAGFAHAETSSQPAASQATEQPRNPPQLSDLPLMKAEGERIAALMEKLAKESDPAERRRIMSELTCAQ